MRRLVPPSTLLLVFLVAAPARAAFGPPEPVSPPIGQNATGVAVATSPSGRSLLAWSQSDGAHLRIEARFRELDGSYGPVLTLSGPKANSDQAQVALDASGDGVVVWRARTSPYWRIQGRVVHADGQLSSILSVSGAGVNLFPHVAIGSRGPALAVWTHFDPSRDEDINRTQAAPLTIAGGVGKREIISPPAEISLDNPGVAVDPAGKGIVTWQTLRAGIDLRIDARPWSHTGGFGAVQELTAPLHTNRSPTVAVNGAGQGFVAWQHTDANGDFSVWGVRDTVDGVAGTPFEISPPETATDREAPALGLDGDGNAVVAWARKATASTLQVRARWVKPGDTLAPVRNVSGQVPAREPASGVVTLSPHVAVSPPGEAVFAWHQFDVGLGRFQIHARARFADRTWAPGEQLTTSGTSTFPVVGLDDAGDALVAWDGTADASIIQAAAGP